MQKQICYIIFKSRTRIQRQGGFIVIYLKQIFCVLQALLCIVSSFSVYDSNFKLSVDRAAMELTSVADFSFDSITAEELKIKNSEKEKCRQWFNDNILCTDSAPAYDFTVGSRKFSRHRKDWNISVGEESAAGAVYRNGKTTYITLEHKKSDLTATVEATIYEDNATCEWTVFIKNNGDEKSPVIKDFYAADCDIETGRSEVYFSNGANTDADDFELHKSLVSLTPMTFNANGGRTMSFLPYFNICGHRGGVVAAVGWTGQWHATLSQKISAVHLTAKQEYFKAYLNSGEEVRSPLVSLTFYDSKNPVKGFNSFRKWESDCVYTESAFPVTCTVIAGEFDTRNADQFVDFINSMSEEACEASDFLWMDAGWYKYNEGWYDGVGNWTPNEERFPNGLLPVSQAAKNRGMNFLLWYEPERCCENTTVYNECQKHEHWLIKESDSTNMVNLAEDGACEYLGNLVANSIKDNGVGLYRQDFNFTPLPMWRNADKEWYDNRTGITENHYVTNLYRYLDRLIEVNPGLIIDNCASGGRRLDIEMSRRSIPLWRTDYNCCDSTGAVHADSLEATQCATYGISFWMPLTGTGINLYSEYADRSLITACSQRPGYETIRKYTDKNYFPVFYGGLDTESFHAVQFGDETEGAAIIYRRENVKENSFRLVFNGLSPEKNYELRDYDSQDIRTVYSGAELMSDGVTVNINETPKAEIVLYIEIK